ncbi:hypothetical protein [Parabacteroides pacaensis]|uniref:hypothetical protein n=1 Tax=Parabacteroides pacaensis TaxID=2086575 RepID=UPI000D0F5259|nr:hypothetical protein [Parabacteroides pacaensis]
MQQKNMLTDLFAGQIPSVKRFYELLSERTDEERGAYLEFAYREALSNWDGQNERYHTFFERLVVHDRQPFLNYLLNHTILGGLRYDLQEPELMQKLLHVMEQSLRDDKTSSVSLAFSYQLCFVCALKLSTLTKYIRTSRMDTDEILELFRRVEIHNVDGDLGEQERGKLIVR